MWKVGCTALFLAIVILSITSVSDAKNSARCQVPHVILPCRMRQDMWYFDWGTKQCLYISHGCLNANQFINETECLKSCSCFQRPLKSGICRMRIWVFNERTGECERSSGCVKAGRSFLTKELCLKECSCDLLPSVGNDTLVRLEKYC